MRSNINSLRRIAIRGCPWRLSNAAHIATTCAHPAPPNMETKGAARVPKPMAERCSSSACSAARCSSAGARTDGGGWRKACKSACRSPLVSSRIADPSVCPYRIAYSYRSAAACSASANPITSISASSSVPHTRPLPAACSRRAARAASGSLRPLEGSDPPPPPTPPLPPPSASPSVVAVAVASSVRTTSHATPPSAVASRRSSTPTNALPCCRWYAAHSFARLPDSHHRASVSSDDGASAPRSPGASSSRFFSRTAL